MYCRKCGRRMSGEYDVCRACGAPLVKRQRVLPSSLKEVLCSDAKLGKRFMRVWLLCAILAASLAVLAVSAHFIPALFSKVTDKADELIPQHEVIVTNHTPIGKVEGNIIIIPSDELGECVVTSETAWSDESWERDLTVDGTVKLRLLRYKTAGDEWINTHIFALYPQIKEAESFPECDDVSGWDANRIQISATSSTDGMVIEAVRASDGVYDYIYVLEIPEASFADYEEATNRWAEAAMIVNSDDLSEQRNPATVSGADAAAA